ncbi:transcriptional regulator, AlpA family [Pseudomonas syringae]|uniref:Prophage CP4-57 regulatory, AlpA-like protein n=1 Tax=Pseudomonas syringae pv. apii TaxID=81036 RepID=A0A3M3RH82_9PSED|nr:MULTISPECIES: AlpA family phage regulatory protein [Pseudomonas syringae group]RMN51746.1 Prophage CP4-57 regulatory, AlpA-like protein [Pseudomonas syringae pv. apii]RMN53662.1 Prophage CP4-57 regulatory, AlpA-like protein [Pseudomonas syringae pv. apii]RMN95749.1 Prophage CP4-57 regulatory, AlpA-like protein [Pseudomonas syringae pv. apii]SDZ53667.1 transcriptional regulator, AlpA family [Pseudomonas syringae]
MNSITLAPTANTDLRATYDPATTIIRMDELEAITGIKRPTVYKRLKDDPTFPRPVPLSNSKCRGAPVGWILSEVQTWVRTRIALRSEAA